MFPVYDENGVRYSEFRPWVTWTLVATNTLITLFLGLLPGLFVTAIAYQLGVVPVVVTGSVSADEAGLVIRPELTLLTYGFIHAKWSHLASNMLVLWVFGDNIERATGHLRFLLFYLLCQLAGALAHVVSDPGSYVPAIGASAAVSGVVAAYLLVRPRARVVMLVLGVMTINFPAYWVIGGWLFWQLAEFLISRADSNVAYLGHFGGFVAGLMLILPLRRPGVRILGEREPWAAFQAGIVGARRGWRHLHRATDALLLRRQR
jgi:membrane associated rhomboid family serine protease